MRWKEKKKLSIKCTLSSSTLEDHKDFDFWCSSPCQCIYYNAIMMSLSQDSSNDLDEQSSNTKYINGSYHFIPKNVKENSKNDLDSSSDGSLDFRGAKKDFNGISSIGYRVPHLMGKTCLTLFILLSYLTSHVCSIIVWVSY